jgi:CheY-like chemotaxis protein
MHGNDPVCVIADDMFFLSKIRGAAEQAGRKVERVRSLEQIEREVTARPPALFIVDLNSNSFDTLSAIRFIKSHASLSAIPVVGFLSHVQEDLKSAAREAGCDHVLPRSLFSSRLTDIISGRL